MKKSQLKSLTLLPLRMASFLCGYFSDPTRFEPFFNFWVVNGYNKITRLETKCSGATNLSRIFLDKMFPWSQFHIRIILTEIELSFQSIINGGEYCDKTAFKGVTYHQSGHAFDR